MTADVQRELAEALASEYDAPVEWAERLLAEPKVADALVRLIADAEKRAAAAALRDAAEEYRRAGYRDGKAFADDLDARAAALDPAGAASGETT